MRLIQNDRLQENLGFADAAVRRAAAVGRSVLLHGCILISLICLTNGLPAQGAPLQRQPVLAHLRQQPVGERLKTTAPEPLQPEAQSTMPPDIERILERGKLVVAVLGSNNAPFFMDLEQGELGGLDIQLATAIADELGVPLELNRAADTFDGVVDTVYEGEADIAISKISRTMKRAARVRFSQPYLEMRQGLLVNRLQLAQQTSGENVTETIRHLTGKVGVIAGSSYVGFLQQKFPKASIVELDSWTDIVEAVSSGDILAGYRDELEIKKVVLTQPDAALKLQTAVLIDTRDVLAMVLPWNSPHLLAFVNQYLDTLDAEFTVDGVLQTYADYWSLQKKT